MGRIRVEAEGLGKRYRIRHVLPGQAGLRDAVGGAARRLLGKRRTRTEEFRALREVGFSVEEGEVLGLIGANGAGKSTLLKILARITLPSEGRAVLRGRVASLLEVGTGFHPELSGRENIYMNGAVLGMRRDEIRRKFDAIVDFAGVETFLDTPVKRYSSGMYVRLAFAVAAHLEPEILLVDEVLAVGDAAFQRKCLGKMGEVARSGRTILFVSHSMHSVQRLCDRVMLLEDGAVAMLGDPAEATRRYLAGQRGAEAEGGDLGARPRPRREHGTRIRIRRVRLESASGEPRARFHLGEPWRVRIEADAREDLDGLAAVIGIEGSLGERIATADSETASVRYTARAGETLRCSALFQSLSLCPGTYWITASARSGGEGLDIVHSACRMEILDAPAADHDAHATAAGYVLPRPDWSAPTEPGHAPQEDD
jgi:lipopolysaccharide transport system ATP-binding protein